MQSMLLHLKIAHQDPDFLSNWVMLERSKKEIKRIYCSELDILELSTKAVQGSLNSLETKCLSFI
jgi:hypothetical protein